MIPDAGFLWWTLRPATRRWSFGTRAPVVFADRLDAVLADVAEDADAPGCAAELDGARRILREGTSADAQVTAHAAAAGGPGAAVAAAVDWLAAETARGWRTIWRIEVARVRVC